MANRQHQDYLKSYLRSHRTSSTIDTASLKSSESAAKSDRRVVNRSVTSINLGSTKSQKREDDSDRLLNRSVTSINLGSKNKSEKPKDDSRTTDEQASSLSTPVTTTTTNRISSTASKESATQSSKTRPKLQVHFIKPVQYRRKLGLDGLPDELLLKIFSYMSTCDLLALASINRRWQCLSNDNLLWYKLYLTMSGKDRPKEAVDECDWKMKCLGQYPSKELSPEKLGAKLKKVDRFTGLPCATEKLLQEFAIKWALVFVVGDKDERCFFHSDTFFFTTSLCVRWYSLVPPPIDRIKRIKIYAAKPVCLDAKGKGFKNSPCRRSLILESEISVRDFIAGHKAIGEDKSVSLYDLSGGVLVATWKDGGELAFVTLNIHKHLLVQRCLLGNSSKCYACPIPKIPRDDVDTKYGLHDYSCTIELRNQRTSFWNQQFSNLFCQPANLLDGFATYLLINPQRSYERSSFAKTVIFPWKTEAFTGKIQNVCIMDVTLLDERKNPMWCVSSPVQLETHSLSNTRYEYEGDLSQIQLVDPRRGIVSMTLIWEESTAQYFVIGLEVKQSIAFVNEWFGTKYGRLKETSK